MAGATLQPEVAEKYELATHHTILHRGPRTIVLTTLTLKEADELVAAGDFPYLKLKVQKPKKATKKK